MSTGYGKSPSPKSGEGVRLIDTSEISASERYQLLTSLVVPRPIGWISTWGSGGTPNLAPFSYFSALSHAPILVGISVGHRSTGPKDTLINIRNRLAFCANVVTASQLDVMNLTSAEVDAAVDEFELAGLKAEPSNRVDAPYVDGCPAVLECVLEQEVALGAAPNTLVIGRVVGIRLDASLPRIKGRLEVDPEALLPVGRLSGIGYAMPGDIRKIARPG